MATGNDVFLYNNNIYLTTSNGLSLYDLQLVKKRDYNKKNVTDDDVINVVVEYPYIFGMAKDKIYKWNVNADYILHTYECPGVQHLYIDKNSELLYASSGNQVYVWNYSTDVFKNKRSFVGRIIGITKKNSKIYFLGKGASNDKDFISQWSLTNYEERIKLPYKIDEYVESNIDNLLFIKGDNRLWICFLDEDENNESILEPRFLTLEPNTKLSIEYINDNVFIFKYIDKTITGEYMGYEGSLIYRSPQPIKKFFYLNGFLYMLINNTLVKKQSGIPFLPPPINTELPELPSEDEDDEDEDEDEDDNQESPFSFYRSSRPIEIETSNKYEEDSDDFSSVVSDNKSIIHSGNHVKNCTNASVITLDDYTQQDDPIIIYTPNSQKKFEKGICITKEELVDYLKNTLDSMMTIYTTPSDRNVAGLGGKPTAKIVVRLPVNNIYITMGSMERILRENNINKTWYALPLFGGKRRRVGNLQGFFGASMNHGQIPGFLIYKIFTENEIKRNVQVKETGSDYPVFLVENAFLLDQIVGRLSSEDLAKRFVYDLTMNL